MKLKLLVVVFCVMLSACMTATIPEGYPEKFDITFIESCPDGYRMRFKKGYCDNGDCPCECVLSEIYEEERPRNLQEWCCETGDCEIGCD